MKIVTWSATYGGCRHDARLDLCLAHNERVLGGERQTPEGLPSPVQVYHGAHEGRSCDWCAAEAAAFDDDAPVPAYADADAYTYAAAHAYAAAGGEES